MPFLKHEQLVEDLVTILQKSEQGRQLLLTHHNTSTGELFIDGKIVNHISPDQFETIASALSSTNVGARLLLENRGDLLCQVELTTLAHMQADQMFWFLESLWEQELHGIQTILTANKYEFFLQLFAQYPSVFMEHCSTTQKHNGLTFLHILTANSIGVSILEALFAVTEISAEFLNRPINQGKYAGHSLASLLASTAFGVTQLYADNYKLGLKITQATLNFIFVNIEGDQMSVAGAFAEVDIGLQLLHALHRAGVTITPTVVNSRHSGFIVAATLIDSDLGLDYLCLDDYALGLEITGHSLNYVDNDQKTIALDLARLTKGTELLCAKKFKLGSQITAATLNRFDYRQIQDEEDSEAESEDNEDSLPLLRPSVFHWLLLDELGQSLLRANKYDLGKKVKPECLIAHVRNRTSDDDEDDIWENNTALEMLVASPTCRPILALENFALAKRIPLHELLHAEYTDTMYAVLDGRITITDTIFIGDEKVKLSNASPTLLKEIIVKFNGPATLYTIFTMLMNNNINNHIARQCYMAALLELVCEYFNPNNPESLFDSESNFAKAISYRFSVDLADYFLFNVSSIPNATLLHFASVLVDNISEHNVEAINYLLTTIAARVSENFAQQMQLAGIFAQFYYNKHAVTHKKFQSNFSLAGNDPMVTGFNVAASMDSLLHRVEKDEGNKPEETKKVQNNKRIKYKAVS